MSEENTGNRSGSSGSGARVQSAPTPAARSRPAKPLTLTALAEHKKLPTQFLTELGLRSDPEGVMIPYYDVTGLEVAWKKRTALAAGEGSYWPAGKPLSAYGEWRLDLAKKAGFLILVEGESDCWALWYHGVPALGLPGACAAKTLAYDFIGDIPTLYIHREPDQGGEQFVKGILQRLQHFRWEGQIYEFRLVNGVKDPADLHVQHGDHFKEYLQQAITSSKPRTWKVLPCDGPRPKAAVARSSPVAQAAPALEEVQAINLATVQAKPVSWLWPERIPLGKLTILDGDPGLGKSTLALDIAARVTCGRAMPLAPAQSAMAAAHVLLLTAEDGVADTLQPRLVAAGADLHKVSVFESVPTELGLRPPVLPDDLPQVRQILQSSPFRLMVIDPLMAFLGDQVNSNNDQNTRRALHPLAKLADDLGVAILVVRHLNKGGAGNPLYRGGGSIGIIGAARAGLLVVKDPDDGERRLLAVTKSNLAKKAPTLQFMVMPAGKDSTNLRWIGTNCHEADTLLLQPQDAGDPSALEEAVEFMQKVLEAGSRRAADVKDQATNLGIALSTLRRAKSRLGVQAQFEARDDGRGGVWWWSLPQEEAFPPAPPGPIRLFNSQSA